MKNTIYAVLFAVFAIACDFLGDDEPLVNDAGSGDLPNIPTVQSPPTDSDEFVSAGGAGTEGPILNEEGACEIDFGDTGEAGAAPFVESACLEQTVFALPDDGEPNDNSRIGPFCCTGHTVTVRDLNGNVAGYAYAYTWQGRAFNFEGKSYAPDIEVLLSAVPYFGSDEQVEASVRFHVSEMVPGSSRTVDIGALRYTAVIEEAVLVCKFGSMYYEKGTVRMRLDAEPVDGDVACADVGGDAAGGAGGTDSGVGGSSPAAGGASGSGASDGIGGQSGESGEGTISLLPLEIELAADTPETQIVTPSVNFHFTKYVVTNPNDTPVSIDTFDVDEVDPNGKIADFASIYVQALRDGVWFWSITHTAYPMDSYDLTQHFAMGPIPFSNVDFEVAANGQIELEVLGLMSIPRAPITQESACVGVPCSGDTPALKLMNVVDSNGVRAVIRDHDPEPMVLRKARPRLMSLPLDDHTVQDGVSSQLAHFKARTYYSDFAAMKAIVFHVELQGASLQEFEFHRNGVKMDTVQLFAGTAMDHVDLLQDPLTESSDVAVIFEREEILTDPDTVYALVATSTRLQPGALIQTSWNIGTISEPSVTGWFMGLFGSYVWLNNAERSHATHLLWSDLSSVPHSDNPSAVTGTSKDWMTDWGIEYEMMWSLSVY